jgi:hypothetical protein
MQELINNPDDFVDEMLRTRLVAIALRAAADAAPRSRTTRETADTYP